MTSELGGLLEGPICSFGRATRSREQLVVSHSFALPLVMGIALSVLVHFLVSFLALFGPCYCCRISLAAHLVLYVM